MINKFFERLQYEGYTYDELCAAAGGGGKYGGGQTDVAKPMQTTTSVGNAFDAPAVTLEDEDPLNKVEKKKLGTRGLQIPLADTTTTTTPNTAAASGVSV